jgi:FPC/CPF motif-containing protein YcgG
VTEVKSFQSHVRELLDDKVNGDEFSCVAGKTAWRRSKVVHRHLGRMGTPAATTELHSALVHFGAHREEIDELLATFVATFDGPWDMSEEEFEAQLWRQLQLLHGRDVRRFSWDPSVDRDPGSPQFGFSVGGHAFFVVGLHSNASRITRRFPLPALVFNSHLQFERLKERGIYQRIQTEVRRREMILQGSLNPNLSDFGTKSEAAQYSGRATPADWRCPFRPEPEGQS